MGSRQGVRSVLLAGGGTAGHVNPLLAVAEELRRRDPQIRITVLGTESGLESRLVPERGLPLAFVPRVPLPRRPTAEWAMLPARLRDAVRTAGEVVDETGAQVVIGFGGYVSTPAYLAARSRHVPVVVHEQNARPGLANRLGSRWAADVAVTFPGTPLPGAQVTGLPLRPEIAALVADRARDAEATRVAAAERLGLDPGRTTLVVTGGSLGALSLNRAMVRVAAELLDAGVQVLHLAGAGKGDEVRDVVAPLPGGERYHVHEYLSEMQHALAVADVVVGRAGAGTVSELAALGLPAVYVPLPVGNGEQRLNAAPVVAAGGGLLVADADLTPAWLAEHLFPLLIGETAAAAREQMGEAAASVGLRDGAARVADLVEAHLPPVDDGGLADNAVADNAAADGAVADDGGLADLGRVHLVGIGGAGMSAIAGLLVAAGLPVSGSDAKDGPALDGLRSAGARVWVGHDAAHVEEVDTVVVSTAVRESNPELARARERGVRVLHRSEALAALMRGREAIAVAGAHGKTTTSAMIATALVHAGLDPSFAIGGDVLSAAGSLGGSRAGAGRAFVAEADESDGSFLAYSPDVAVVTNVEPDHLDHYGTREAFDDAFVAFARRIRDGGLLVACADDAGASRLVERVRHGLAARGVDVVTYGRGAASDVVVEPLGLRDGRWSVRLRSADPTIGDADLSLTAPGEHNALNAAAAFVAARRAGASAEQAAEGLAGFRGTGRRFEARGEVAGVRVVDDYAHHPTEVAALLRAARTVAGEGRVLVVFQPHLFSRTRAFAAEFGTALDLADVVVVTDVYAAREDVDPTVTGALVADAVPTAGRARFVPDRHDAARALAAEARPGDLLLTVGAGDVTELGAVVLASLAEREAPTSGAPTSEAPEAEGPRDA
ncbi:UDP-N-acetylmuramate--L-alanine ligase [Cellulomonas chengniuliangii]|uniref:UDP-N-acetylmuramate--L-alanine ligase n=1 Tax=Cellulomonas chengniuliangii TaxID=2968084 RepID=UPI0027E073B7|nr:UDP-N-acetylmuramate--L-alanine ligase [Cellulomonas chengniuliangii]